MTKQTKKAPSLRFSEFNSGWRSILLRDISRLITSGSRGWASFYSSRGAKFIRMTNIARDGIALNLNDLKYVNLPEGNSEGARTALRPGDILISITAELGKIGLAPTDIGEAYINQHVALVRPSSGVVVPRWLAYYLSSPVSNRRLNRLNDSGTKSGLNLDSIRSFRVTAPDLSEQENVADFLSSVDGKIELLEKRMRSLEKYKKGVMQAIFTQKFRFKANSGNEFSGRWEKNRLSEIASPVTKTAEKPDGLEVLTISAGHGFITQNTRFSQVIAGNSIEKYVVLGRGELSYNRGASKKFRYGCVYMQSSYDAALVPNVYKSFSIKTGLVPEFYAQLFTTGFIDNQLRKFISSSARMDGLLNISTRDFYNIVLPVPSLEEQQKIADFLSAIDDKIKLEEKKLEQAKQFKKALLQQMFV